MSVSDPLALGQRLTAVLQTGRRTATYKLATLMSILDFCVENLPEKRNAPLFVPVRDLAERVLEIYWHQVRPFEGASLKQSTQPVASILRQALALRTAAGVGAGRAALVTARLRVPQEYESAVEGISTTLLQQPLYRLQRIGTGSSPAFLYDDSWMHDGVSRAVLADHNGGITLYPGVAAALAQLSGLLKPSLEIMWVDDIRRWNKSLVAEVPDIAGHLFGRARLSLTNVRTALAETFGAKCFYCDVGLGRSAPVDHVLPWSRVGIDGLANLVLACGRCNGDKSETLPVAVLVESAIGRDTQALDGLSIEISWPTQRDRVIAAARGLYRSQPLGTPLWSGYRSRSAIDAAWPANWLLELAG